MWSRVFLRLIYLLVGLYLSPVFASAASVATVHEYRLDNGLKLIVKEDHRAPVVFASIWYKVGGSYEPRGITGISHALEHMMFRGTSTYGPGQLSTLVNSAGGEQNAMTSDDFTAFYQSLPADQLALSFRLEADRMHNLSLDKEAFAKEIQVVMEERRLRTEDNPQTLTTERFKAAAFINDPYSHPVVGWMSDLKQMTVDDLRAWYQQWYVPNNAVVIVVGDVQPESVFALAKQYFAAVPAKPLPALKPVQLVTGLGVRRVNVQAPAQLPWVILGYNTPSLTTDPQSNDPYALMVLAYLLGGGDSARLNRDLVRGQQIATSITADYDIYNLYSNVLTISATPAKSATVVDLENAVKKAIQDLQTNLVTTAELSRAKALLVAGHVFDQDSATAQAINLGLPEMTGLSWRVENDFVSHVQSVTAEQVRAVAKKYLGADNLTVGVLEPTGQSTTPASGGEIHAPAEIIH